MEYNKNLVWTPAPTYAYSVDKAVILTTLKQGTTYLSNIVYNGIRARYNFDLVNQDVIDFGLTDGGDWILPDGVEQEYYEKIKKSSLIDLNLILMGNNVKKTIIIIRNPVKRIASSILEDTVRYPNFLTDGARGDLENLYKSLSIPMPSIVFKNNSWQIKGKSTDLQTDVFYEYIISNWIAMLNKKEGPGAFHHISQWESFVYALINHPNFNKDKFEIYDLDEINLNDIVQKNIVKLPIEENNEKIHKMPDNFKKGLLKYILTKSIFGDYIKELVSVDFWFYSLLKGKKVNIDNYE